jgi:hypothetical protein
VVTLAGTMGGYFVFGSVFFSFDLRPIVSATTNGLIAAMALIIATTQIFGNTYRGRATDAKLKELTDGANEVRNEIIKALNLHFQSRHIT